MSGEIDRREFIGCLLSTGCAYGCRMAPDGKKTFDENLTVFISDVHILPRPCYQYDRFEYVVNEILAMRPLPQRVICFGDVSRSLGVRADYESSYPLFRRIVDSGIALTLGTGNHDRRRNLLAYWPEYAERTLVKDRIVTVTDLGFCDLILLDTLFENHQDETRRCEGDGQLSGAQWDWLKKVLPRWKRPVFVGAHHPWNELKDGDSVAFNDLMMMSPKVIGYIHGHDHVWRKGLIKNSKGVWPDPIRKRSLCLPSTGHWGDIGYVKFRVSPGRAVAELVQFDRYYPDPSHKTSLDDVLLHENQGQHCVFEWGDE